MSLPLFDKKRMASTIMERRNPDGTKGASAAVNEEDSEGSDLKNLSVDLLQAIERKSPDEIAKAFQAMYDSCESSEDDQDDDNGMDSNEEEQ